MQNIFSKSTDRGRECLNTPYLSVAQIKELDRRATEEFGIPAETLMENAGKAVAEETIKFLEESKIKKPWKILVLCGGGNNGGDGLVATRILKEKGAEPAALILKKLEHCSEMVQKNFKKITDWNEQMIIKKRTFDLNFLKKFRLIIDAILGIGFHGIPRSPLKETIDKINSVPIPVVAVDVPSGFNADSGKPMNVCVKADLTVTMEVMKKGFLSPKAVKWTGKIIKADIGYPRELIKCYLSKK